MPSEAEIADVALDLENGKVPGTFRIISETLKESESIYQAEVAHSGDAKCLVERSDLRRLVKRVYSTKASKALGNVKNYL